MNKRNNKNVKTFGEYSEPMPQENGDKRAECDPLSEIVEESLLCDDEKEALRKTFDFMRRNDKAYRRLAK